MHFYITEPNNPWSAAAIQIGRGWSGYQVASVGSLDGGGLNDVLAVNKSTGLLYRYPLLNLQFKGGPFQVGRGWGSFRLVPTGDLTGDGRSDLLGVREDGALFLYASRGGGLFGSAQQVGRGWAGLDLVSGGDLDGDGRNDLVGWTAGGALLFYKGLGQGRFASPVQVGRGWGAPFKGPDCSGSPPATGQMLPIPWNAPGKSYVILD